jgi:hypothetical protein
MLQFVVKLHANIVIIEEKQIEVLLFICTSLSFIMRSYLFKLKYIFLPFIKGTIVTAFIYVTFYYIFIIVFEINISETVVNLGFPVIFSFLTTIVYLGPRVDYFVISRKRRRGNIEALLFFPIAGFVIASIHALVAIGSEKVTIINVADIKQHPDSRFYYINNFEVDTTYTNFSSEITKSRKHRRTHFALFIVAPLKNKSEAISINTHKYWVMESYYISADPKKNTDSIFKKFTKTANTHFKKVINFPHFNHFERMLHSDEREHALFAISNIITSENSKNCTVLTREFDPLDIQAGVAIFWMIIALFGGSIVTCVILIFLKVDATKRLRPEDHLWFKIKKYYRLFIDSFKDNK